MIISSTPSPPKKNNCKTNSIFSYQLRFTQILTITQVRKMSSFHWVSMCRLFIHLSSGWLDTPNHLHKKEMELENKGCFKRIGSPIAAKGSFFFWKCNGKPVFSCEKQKAVWSKMNWCATVWSQSHPLIPTNIVIFAGKLTCRAACGIWRQNHQNIFCLVGWRVQMSSFVFY